MLALNKGEYLGALSNSLSACGVLIGVTEYLPQKTPGPMHFHENCHLSFVVKGTMEVTRSTVTGSRTAVEPYSFMQTGEQHKNRVLSGHCKNLNLELEPEFFHRYQITQHDVAVGLLKIQLGPALLMVRLYKEYLFADEHLEDAIHMLLLEAAGNWKSTDRHFPPWIRIVKEFLHDKWNESITLAELGKAAGIHPVTISKYFAAYFGMGFGEYRRRLRIEKAIHFIAAEKKPLTGIAYNCGFFDQSHFIKAFKECTGFLPKDLKRN